MKLQLNLIRGTATLQKEMIHWEEAESAQKATEDNTQTPLPREPWELGHKTTGGVEHEG